MFRLLLLAIATCTGGAQQVVTMMALGIASPSIVATGEQQLPAVYWVSHPVMPNETVIAIGGGLMSIPAVNLSPAEQQQVGGENLSSPTTGGHSAGLAFALPARANPGVYNVSTPEGRVLTSINAPDVWWSLGDAGASASSPGGWLRIIGRSLAFRDNGDCVAPVAPADPSESALRTASAMQLADDIWPKNTQSHQYHNTTRSGNKVAAVEVIFVNVKSSKISARSRQLDATCWWIETQIPSDLDPGQYEVKIANGLGLTVWGTNHLVEVVQHPPWPLHEFAVNEYNGSIAAALAAAAQNGGGVVTVESGRWLMADGEVLVLGPFTVLRGALNGATSTLVWANNTRIPPIRPHTPKMTFQDNPGAALISGTGPFAVEGLNIEVTSSVGAVVFVPAEAHGSWVRGVNITQRFAATETHSNGSAFVIKADHVTLENNLVIHGPERCWRGPELNQGARSWQQSTGFYLNGSDSVLIRNNTFFTRCQGYAAMGASRVLMDNNTLVSIGLNLSNGNGFNTMRHGEPKSTRFISFVNNYQAESLRSVRNGEKCYAELPQKCDCGRYESWTLDGPGSSYLGRLTQHPENASFPRTHDVTVAGPLPNTSHWQGGLGWGAMVAVDGTSGAGQVRRVFAQINRTFLLDAPFTVPLSSDALVSVLPWRSHFLIAGNTFWRGTTVQLFGASWHSIIADNIATGMEPSGRSSRPNAGFSAWGRSYGASAQPCLYAMFVRNKLINSGHLRTTSWDDNHPLPKPYVGPGYNRGHVHRRNVLIGTNMSVEGSATDILLEHNTGSDGAALNLRNVSGLHGPVFVTERGNDL